MKRIIYAVFATISGLILLLSYRTSTGADLTAAPVDTATGTTTSDTTATPAPGAAASGGDDQAESSDVESSDGDSTGTASGAGSASGTGSSGTGSASTGSTGTGSSGSGSASTASAFADGTYAGEAASTRYGPVQVQITVSGGAVTAVDVLQYPHSNRKDQMINARALPVLTAATVSSQSANVDIVSGATYTSNGYAQSLQSALDQAQQ